MLVLVQAVLVEVGQEGMRLPGGLVRVVLTLNLLLYCALLFAAMDVCTRVMIAQ